jgi:hypothetical protein
MHYDLDIPSEKQFVVAVITLTMTSVEGGAMVKIGEKYLF